ncbi:MAG: hypothetical protein AB1665_04340 [Candidatus Thermoplasmatota archaeon]
MSSHPCAVCGSPLAWVPQYRQYYCYRCQTYYPPGKPAPQGDAVDGSVREGSIPPSPIYRCRTCNTQLQFIEQYQRWYCYTCRAYR